MDEPDVETLLRSYRPVRPPPALRGRILTPQDARRVWPWSLAAAALLVVTLALQLATARLNRGASARFASAPSGPSVEELAELLGNDDQGRLLAQRIIVEEELRAARAAAERDPMTLLAGASQ
jgi:hypothetical protein